MRLQCTFLDLSKWWVRRHKKPRSEQKEEGLAIVRFPQADGGDCFDALEKDEHR